MKYDEASMLAAIRRVVSENGGEAVTSRIYEAAFRRGSEPSPKKITTHFERTWAECVALAMGTAKTEPPPPHVASNAPVAPHVQHAPPMQHTAFVRAMDASAANDYPPRITSSAPRDPVDVADERDKHSRLKSAHDDLVNRLREERKRNEFILSMRDVETPTVLRSERTSGLREMVAVAQLSDAHVEEPVDPAKCGYRNEYNLDIAHRSLARFKQGIIDLVQHHRASGKVVVRDVVLAMSGDLMTGYIHEELVETSQLSPVETALWLKPRLGDIIRGVLDELDLRSIVVPFSYGNHGRTTPKRRIATGAENSYEWLLGRMLESDFANDPRVKFDTSPWAHQYAVVFDKTLHFTHGDEVMYQGGVGGLAIPLMKRLPAWDELRYAHVHHCGHFHQRFSSGRVQVNSSVIGYNQYAISIGAKYEPPSQNFYMLDAKRGPCHFTPIWVRGDDEMREAA